MKLGNTVMERPQFFWMRVAIGIHLQAGDISDVLETYELLSLGYYVHATPTLLNAGKAAPQLSSCFMYSADSTNLRSLYEGISDAAHIFMADGGIGVSLHAVPSKR